MGGGVERGGEVDGGRIMEVLRCRGRGRRWTSAHGVVVVAVAEDLELDDCGAQHLQSEGAFAEAGSCLMIGAGTDGDEAGALVVGSDRLACVIQLAVGRSTPRSGCLGGETLPKSTELSGMVISGVARSVVDLKQLGYYCIEGREQMRGDESDGRRKTCGVDRMPCRQHTIA